MSPLRFHIDRIAACKAYGWVINQDSMQQRLLIRITVNNTVIATEHANIYRQDLRNAGLGDGTYGFEIYIGMLPYGKLMIFADQYLIYSTELIPTLIPNSITENACQNYYSSVYFSVRDRDALDAFLAQRRARAVFIFAVTAFYPRIQRHQQLAYNFSQQGIDVYYVEPLFRGGQSVRLQRVDTPGNVYILNLPTYGQSPDFITGNLGTDLVQHWKVLIDALSQLYNTSYCIWTAPQWLALLYQKLQCDLSIFDFIDDYCATFSQPNLRNLLKQALHEVTGITYTSAYLPGIPKSCHKKTMQIRNGFDQKNLSFKKSSPRPITLGYIGALDTINGKWLSKFLEANSIPSLIMGSGNLIDSLSHLAKQYQHIFLTGEVPHAMAMTNLQRCRFGAVFFRSQTVARWVNPVKCYEYIALEMPVLTSHQIDLEPELYQCCHLITTPKTYFSSIKQKKIQQHFLRVRDSLDIQQYSWQYRCQQMRIFLESF